MKRLIVLSLMLLLWSGVLLAQSLPALEVSKEIVKGSLPNGIEYYLVNNSLQKGFADFAVVQREDLDNDRDKKALTYLPHFGFRKPYKLLSESGVGFQKNGFVTKLPDATYFYFKDVPTYKNAVADSTLLMIMDVAAVSRKPQAIIVSGDIDIAKIKERMSLLSIMAGKLETSWESTYYQWNTSDNLVLITNPNLSQNTATIEAIYRSTRQSKNDMNTALPLVIRSYSNILESILEKRLTKAFAENGVPLGYFDFTYSDSSQGPYDEFFSFKIYTSAAYLTKATELLATELASIDKNGALIDEIEIATIYNTPNSTIKQFERHITNEEYVAKCLASYLYGANLAPEVAVNNMINNRNLTADQKLKLFNNYAAALLDSSKNLTLRITSPQSVDNDALKKAFLASWEKPAENNFAHGMPRVSKPKTKAKLKTEASEPISGGSLLTFSNGMKVVYKKLETKSEMTYSLVLNNGFTSIPDLKSGEVPYIEKLFNISNIAGISSSDFQNFIAKEGISVKQKVSSSNIEISGTAPSAKLERVMEVLLDIVNDSNIDSSLFPSFKQNALIAEDMLSLSPRDANAKMYAALFPDFAYSLCPNPNVLDINLCERANKFFKEAYSRANDGVLILIGDLELDDVKKSLNKYIAEFSTEQRPAPRVIVKDAIFKGIASLEDESASGIIGGQEISANIALSTPLAYSVANQVALDAALMFVRKELNSLLVEYGAYAEVEGVMDLFPTEQASVYINIHPCNANGLPLGIVTTTPDEIMESALTLFTNLEGIDISQEDLNAYKALINSEFTANSNNPSLINEAVKLRYSNGKDMLSSKSSAINSLSDSKVRTILSALSSGTRVEYIIR